MSWDRHPLWHFPCTRVQKLMNPAGPRGCQLACLVACLDPWFQSPREITSRSRLDTCLSCQNIYYIHTNVFTMCLYEPVYSYISLLTCACSKLVTKVLLYDGILITSPMATTLNGQSSGSSIIRPENSVWMMCIWRNPVQKSCLTCVRQWRDEGCNR